MDNTSEDSADKAQRYADVAAWKAMVAIREISAADFDEFVAMNIIAALQGRLAGSIWRHQEHQVQAAEYLTDAYMTLEIIAHDKARE